MGDARFDLAARVLSTGGRRVLLRALAGGGVAAALAAAAAPEAGACRAQNAVCRSNEQCCSGVCRKKGKSKRCRPASFQGTCRFEDAFCQTGFGGCNGVDHCSCARSLTGETMCADVMPCWPCATDADCVPVVGPDAICGRPVGATCNTNGCVGVAGSNGTFCARPCGT
jgi:hypothetical protein